MQALLRARRRSVFDLSRACQNSFHLCSHSLRQDPVDTTSDPEEPKEDEKSLKKRHAASRWRIVDVSDLGELTRKGGVVFPPSTDLIPASQATPWPPLDVSSRVQGEFCYQTPPHGVKAQLVLAAFRAGAEDYLKGWRSEFTAEFEGTKNVGICELSLVDMSVLKMWPFKGMLVNNEAAEVARSAGHTMQVQSLFYFGDLAVLINDLDMTNRLSGYVYLLDSEGRVRWRASGPASEEDLTSLFQAARKLIAYTPR